MPHGPGHCRGSHPGPYNVRTMCRVCWLKHHKNSVPTPLISRPVVAEPPPRRPDCVNLGPIIEHARPGCDRDVHDCAVHDRCKKYPWPSHPMECCETCKDYDSGIKSPSVGVSIGSYNLPHLIELQVKVIRHHCGKVPILIVDDCSDGYGHTPSPDTVFGKLRRIAATYDNVVLFSHPERFGHASGDLSKIWTGLQWAKVRSIEVLAVLSQRLIMDTPQWLQLGGKLLAESGKATLSQICQGRERHPVRSELMLLDVNKWHRPDILDHLMPRRLSGAKGVWGVPAETPIFDDIQKLGGMCRWPLLGVDRYTAKHGQIWHCANSPHDYHDIAKRFGITLDYNFSTDGWRNIQRKEYQG